MRCMRITPEGGGGGSGHRFKTGEEISSRGRGEERISSVNFEEKKGVGPGRQSGGASPARGKGEKPISSSRGRERRHAK